jgi:hypothetical protein
MKAISDCLFGRSSRWKSRRLPCSRSGPSQAPDWVGHYSDFHANLTARLATEGPISAGSPASRSEAVRRPRPNDHTPEQAKAAWLEGWWMDVQESVKRAE